MVTPRSATRSPFFVYLSVAFLAIALVGFSTTFFVPLARGTFSAPPVIYVHGALLFAWLVFLIAQTTLVKSGKVMFHRQAGWFGFLLSIAIVVSGVLVGVFAARRDLAATGQAWPNGAFVNIVIEMALFGSLVGAAIAFRRDSQSHKRLLMLATISALGPAWFRFRHFMPFVPNPLVSFSLAADSILLVLIARDWLLQRRVHPVYVWAGGAMFVVHTIELAAADSPLWLDLGRWLLQTPAA